jgi:hypothetical protein
MKTVLYTDTPQPIEAPTTQDCPRWTRCQIVCDDCWAEALKEIEE